jgi:hypothetical protein
MEQVAGDDHEVGLEFNGSVDEFFEGFVEVFASGF